MFDPTDRPRMFGCAPGVDFPAAVLDGLERRLENRPPEAWARVTLMVNTQRMARRLRAMFDAGPPRLLPRIRMLTDLDDLLPGAPLAPATSPLRRRLELATLITKLIEQTPDLAARTASFDLADSLASLMDEMQGEGVPAHKITELDVSDQSGHWARAQQFITIAQSYIDASRQTPDPEARQRATVEQLAAYWADHPPTDPLLIVGSTGSRGTTQLLMQAVASLPQGAVILPGLDPKDPRAVWQGMETDKSSGEDHPQFRFVKLMQMLGLSRDDIEDWSTTPPPSQTRNALVSLALRPAPVTDAWRIEGPRLTDLAEATSKVTLIEAESPRAEALSIAMRLRLAAQQGQKAALITPDRMLTRQVTAALDRWNILPDDSAGTPLHLTPPGRFLRQVAGLFTRQLDAEALLALLKHPLAHSGGARNLHQLNTQRLELQIRKDGLPYPDPAGLERCAQRARPNAPDEMSGWASWVSGTLCDRLASGPKTLMDWVTLHEHVAQTLADGPQPETDSLLWARASGEAARATLLDLAAHAEYGDAMSATDYAALVDMVLQAGEVRDRDGPHPNIMIWGTLEARVQGAELVILAGLNDGTWPEAPPPDPWLNRKMRSDAGLLLPERRIGLSAHDFQQAIAAEEVWLTRSIRSDDAETVPSRWMNRLQNLMTGLPDAGGVAAWKEMKARGAHWLAQAALLDASPVVEKSVRPSPQPPVAARPRRLTITEIQTLIRDPYAIYAKHCLRLRALRPLVQTPDALLRGILSHEVMESFVRATLSDRNVLSIEGLLSHVTDVLDRDVPWPAARALWTARFQRAAEWIVTTELTRQTLATPVALEADAKGKLVLPTSGITLEGRADRIDLDNAGEVILYDYKTGQPPSTDQQKYFDKQLLIEAALIEQGGFADIGPCPVRGAQFIGLGNPPKAVDAPIEDEPPMQVLAALDALLHAYLAEDKGYTSRRAIYTERETRDYDQLARYGEWDVADDAVGIKLT